MASYAAVEITIMQGMRFRRCHWTCTVVGVEYAISQDVRSPGCCVTLYAGRSLEASVVGSHLGTMDESTYNELFGYVSVPGRCDEESKTTD